MADPSLNDPVIIQAARLDASILPRNVFSQSYLLYVIAQGTDVGAVAGKANEAGQGAYDAQVKNDEQDATLADHEGRITANTNAINLLEVRLTTAEGKIVVLRSDVDYLLDEVIDIQADIVTLQDDVTAIQGDYVSKTETANQTVQPVSGSLLIGTIATPTADKLQVAGSENVSVSYKVAGLQVVGARQTGWTASTGTPNKGAFNADLAFTVSATYTQSEIQAIANALTAERQRTKALEDAMRTHGLIN